MNYTVSLPSRQRFLIRSLKNLTSTLNFHYATETACASTTFHIDYAFSDEVLKGSNVNLNMYCNEFVHRTSQELYDVKPKYAKINTVKAELNKCLSKKNAYIVPIGSAANQLLTKSSDLDLVLLPSKDEIEWKKFMTRFNTNDGFKTLYMKQVAERIKSQNKYGSQILKIYSARVPLVRFTSKCGLQVDIQFGNIGPIRSTLFIRTGVEQDERIRMIILWLTHQFKKAGILNSANGLFSRYHVNILVLHFLQAMPYPVLHDLVSICPWLRVSNNWNNAVNVLGRQGSLYVPSKEILNEDSIGSIIVKMIDYYSQVDFAKAAIDIRGRLLERRDTSVSLEIADEYFDESTCRVKNGAYIIKNMFSNLKNAIRNDEFTELFK